MSRRETRPGTEGAQLKPRPTDSSADEVARCLITLQTFEGRDTKLDGEVVRLYTDINLGTLIGGLCDELLRLREALEAVIEEENGVYEMRKTAARALVSSAVIYVEKKG